MSVNKILLKDDRRLINTVKQQRRYIRELKTPQKIGADILQVQSLPTTSTVLAFPGNSTTYTINASQGLLIAWQWIPNNTTLTLWNFLASLYVDPVSFDSNGIPDAAHLYPQGGSLTSAILQNVHFETWVDWATSSDTSNARRQIVNIKNLDSVSHAMTVFVKAYLPNLNQTS